MNTQNNPYNISIYLQLTTIVLFSNILYNINISIFVVDPIEPFDITNVFHVQNVILMKRRSFLKIASAGALFTIAPPLLNSCTTSKKSNTFTEHVFDKLDYAYNALEPYLDAQTMELHYSKHHLGYFNKFTKAAHHLELDNTPMHQIFKNISKYNVDIRNNGGGYYNHSLFWKNLSPNGGKPSDELLLAINKSFGSVDSFKEAFYNEAKTQFGSGWAWLVIDNNSNLKVGNTVNQDNPLMPDVDIQGIPLIAFDVWEHAYYLHYQNKRGDYINNFWNIINWNEVNQRYENAITGVWIG